MFVNDYHDERVYISSLSKYHEGLVKKISFLPLRRKVRKDLKNLIMEYKSLCRDENRPSMPISCDPTEKKEYTVFKIEQIETYLKENY